MTAGQVGGGSIVAPAMLGALTLALLASRRLRGDGVAVMALAATVLLGLLPASRALDGFGSPVLVTIGALSVLGAAVHRSGMIDVPRAFIARQFRVTLPVLVVSAALVALLAGLTGRAGTRTAVAAAAQPAQDAGWRRALPLDAACMLGGLLTLVGGVPLLLVSQLRHDMLGTGLALLDTLPIGAALLAAGLAAFTLGAVFSRRAGAPVIAGPTDSLRRVKSFTSELQLPSGTPMVGRTVAELEAAEDGALSVVALVRDKFRRIDPRPDMALLADDLLVLDCEPAMLQRLLERQGLQPADGPLVAMPAGLATSPVAPGLVEAVITQSSELIGQSARTAQLADRLGVQLLAIGRNDDHAPARLRRTFLRAGDILVLGGDADRLPGLLGGLGCLMLAERRLQIGRRHRIALPAGTLAVALAAAALGYAPLWLALLAGVLALVAGGVLTLAEAYDMVPWPGLVMLAALLPLAAALHASAAAAALAHWAGMHATGGLGMLAATVAAAMLLAWLVGSAAAVLLLAPFAIAVVTGSTHPIGVNMLLVTVAIACSVDMLDGRGLVAVLVPGTSGQAARPWRARLAAAALLFAGATTTLAIALRG